MDTEIIKFIYKVNESLNVKSVYNYGSFIENFLSNTEMEDSTLYFYLQTEHDILNEIKLLNKKLNLNININKKIYYRKNSFEKRIMEIPYWTFTTTFKCGNTINFFLHSHDYMNDVRTDSQNIIMHKWGFMVREHFDKIDNILEITNNLKNNIIRLISKENIFHFNECTIPNFFAIDNDEIFKYLKIQKEYEMRGFEVINGFKSTNEDCCICYEKPEEKVLVLKCNHCLCGSCMENLHKSDMPNRYKCPLCREDITLKTI